MGETPDADNSPPAENAEKEQQNQEKTKKFVSENLRKVFIGGVGPNTNEEALAEYFSKWSTLEDSCILRDPRTKKSKGFAFVIFPEPEIVDEVMSARPHRIDGRNVEVKRPVPSEDVGRPESTVQTTKIFIGSVKEEMTEQDIEQHFGKFGTVVSVALVNDKGTGRKRGFGFVQFADHDCVDKCLLYRHEHRIKEKWIDVKKALSKAELAEVAKRAEEAKARQMAVKKAEREAAEAAREEAEAKARAAAMSRSQGQGMGMGGMGLGMNVGRPMGGPPGPGGPPQGFGNRGWDGPPQGVGGGGGGPGPGSGPGPGGPERQRPGMGWQGGNQPPNKPGGGGGPPGGGWRGDDDWDDDRSGPVGGGPPERGGRPGMMGPDRYASGGPGPGQGQRNRPPVDFDGPSGPKRSFKDGPGPGPGPGGFGGNARFGDEDNDFRPRSVEDDRDRWEPGMRDRAGPGGPKQGGGNWRMPNQGGGGPGPGPRNPGPGPNWRGGPPQQQQQQQQRNFGPRNPQMGTYY